MSTTPFVTAVMAAWYLQEGFIDTTPFVIAVKGT
jgi:hypothetical protein